MSLTILRHTTKERGRARTGTPFESEMSGKHSMIVSSKKYRFANFENYKSKFIGKKLIMLYFEVTILLSI